MHDLPHERLSAAEIRRRFPPLAPPDELEGVWEPNAGVLFPERCIAAQLARARARGAALHANTPVAGWDADGAGFTVSAGGERHAATRLVLAANAWLPGLLPGAALPLTVTRQPLFWFTPEADPQALAPGRLPVHIWEPDGGPMFYGFPAFGGTVKLAIHHGGTPSDPDAVERIVTDDEVDAIRQRVAPFLPRMAGPLARAAVCLYANTPDTHFVVDRHPAHPQALVVSACSGHGFKFSIAIGEAAADLLLDGRARPDLAPFRWRWDGADSTSAASPT
jgi:sarcosine oxidase